MKTSIACLILTFLTNGILNSPNPTENYPNKQTLLEPGLVRLYWKHNNYNITFEMHVKSFKWVQFGLSEHNLTDLVLLELDKSLNFAILDRYINKSNSNQIHIDKKQNWLLISAFKRNEYTVYKLTRSVIACSDQDEDLSFSLGLNKLKYSAGYDDYSVEILNEISIDFFNQSMSRFDCEPTSPTGYYANLIDLEPSGRFRFYWNMTQNSLAGEIHCKTLGWVGFGLSNDGYLNGSDFFIGWIENGTAPLRVFLF